jgi:hypothetical protein
MMISAAIAEVEHGLGLLARLGHVYHLEPGPPYSLPEWPRLLFHVDAAPNGRVVNSFWEARELGPGWWPTLAEAQNKEGVRAQFAGRGGVGDRSLPMLVDGGPAGPRAGWDQPSPPKDNGKLIEEWRAKFGNPATINGSAARGSGAAAQHQPAKTEVSPGVSRQSGLGAEGLSGSWAKAGVHDSSNGTASTVSEDAVQEAGQEDAQHHSQERDGGGDVLPSGLVGDEAGRGGARGSSTNGSDHGPSLLSEDTR